MQPSTNFILAAVAATLAGYTLFGGGGDGGSGTTIDGLSFPATLKMNGVTQALTGGGTRTKYGVAKVYAVALYIHSDGASSSLKKFAGAKAPKQPGFYSALVDGAFAKTLMLQFHRSVSADAMVSALDEAMAKRLPAATVTKFRAAMVKALGDGNIAKGAHLYFMCKASTLLIGSGTPKIDAMLKEKGVCAALFDVYYGKSPVSVPAKENAAVGFAKRGFYA